MHLLVTLQATTVYFLACTYLFTVYYCVRCSLIYLSLFLRCCGPDNVYESHTSEKDRVEVDVRHG